MGPGSLILRSRVLGLGCRVPEVLGPRSQGPRVPGSRVLGSQVPGSRVLGSQVPELGLSNIAKMPSVPGTGVPGSRSQGPRSWVLGSRVLLYTMPGLHRLDLDCLRISSPFVLFIFWQMIPTYISNFISSFVGISFSCIAFEASISLITFKISEYN